MRRFGGYVLVLMMVTLGLVACGSSKKSSSSAGAAGSVPDTIKISGFKFGPNPLTVKAGVKVTVNNADSTDHTVTADDKVSFDTKHVSPGKPVTFSAPAPGTYKFHCAIHSFMTGVLIVT